MSASGSVGTASGTTSVASTGHTHTVTATGSVSLGLNDTSSGGTALITALNAVSSVGGSVTLDNTASSGIKYMQEAEHTHTAAAVSSTGSAVTGVTGGTTSATTKYLKIDK